MPGPDLQRTRLAYRLILAGLAMLVFVGFAYTNRGFGGFWTGLGIVLFGPLQIAPPIGALLWLALVVTVAVAQDLVAIVFFMVAMPIWWFFAAAAIAIASG